MKRHGAGSDGDDGRASPRSQERGPIEAPATHVARMMLANGLRALRSAAPLKRSFGHNLPLDLSRLRALRSAAPLKRLESSRGCSWAWWSPRSQERGPIEACVVAAGPSWAFASPRSQERGPIEARVRKGNQTGSSPRSPRSQERGPIEARSAISPRTRRGCLRALRSAAPLKHGRHWLYRAHGRSGLRALRSAAPLKLGHALCVGLFALVSALSGARPH